MMKPVDGPGPKVTKSEDEWRAELSPEQFSVLREAATEAPGTGEYLNTTTVGVYRCRACDAELFRSEGKFDAQCGWPSFYTPLAGDAVIERPDHVWGQDCLEVLCAACHSHLGHVFAGEGHDTPTDLRYCINSVSIFLDTADDRSTARRA